MKSALCDQDDVVRHLMACELVALDEEDVARPDGGLEPGRAGRNGYSACGGA
jgi:hypothetical protein